MERGLEDSAAGWTARLLSVALSTSVVEGQAEAGDEDEDEAGWRPGSARTSSCLKQIACRTGQVCAKKCGTRDGLHVAHGNTLQSVVASIRCNVKQTPALIGGTAVTKIDGEDAHTHGGPYRREKEADRADVKNTRCVPVEHDLTAHLGDQPKHQLFPKNLE